MGKLTPRGQEVPGQPPSKAPTAASGRGSAGGLVPIPAPAHGQAPAALCTGLPQADADALVKGQGVARVQLWECPSPASILEQKWEMGVAPTPKKQPPAPWYGPDKPLSSPFWKAGGPAEPLSRSAFPERGACPHWEIANSLHGECQLPAYENIHIIKP